MNARSRELMVLLVIVGFLSILFFRRPDIIPLLSNAFSPNALQTELVVWSAEQPSGKTWESLGKGGRIDYPADSGIAGKGNVLTITVPGQGYRGCGLNWKGWFPEDACDDVSQFQSLVFSVRQIGDVPLLDLGVSLVDNQKRSKDEVASNTLTVIGDGGLTGIDRKWRKVTLPLAQFAQNKPLQLKRLWGIDFTFSGSNPAVIQIDRIGFSMERPKTPDFPEQPRYHATAMVDLSKRGHAISDGIYGVCELPDEQLREFGIAITRWGGNTSTRYNWKINADNGASDWFFQNRGTPIQSPTQNAYFKNAQSANSRGATTYQTLPIIGWVAKDNQSSSFSVRKYGPQQQTEPHRADAGNGRAPSGAAIRGNDPNDASIAVGPEFVAEGVALLAQNRGRDRFRYWALDNEPMLWHQTHRDVRPEPLGYDELWERTVKYAEAIKRADPEAKVAGFCSWGWTDLFYSAKDEGNDKYASQPDFRAHGGEPLAEWFIRKCAEYKKKNGRTLIDVFDIHWYPQSECQGKTPYLGKGIGQGLNELRLRSTRDLWDPNYQQESWIRDTVDRKPARVIRRVREWIEQHNPGMQLCLGEYNFGGGDNITGGLAQADVFGILAREKVDLAFIWQTPEGTQNLAWKLFRNYDGAGGRFGDESLETVSSHSNLTVHAARRSDGALTIIAINKNLGGPCDFKLDLVGRAGKMRVWRFDQKTNGVDEMPAEARSIQDSLRLTLPAASASMIVVQ